MRRIDVIKNNPAFVRYVIARKKTFHPYVIAKNGRVEGYANNVKQAYLYFLESNN